MDLGVPYFQTINIEMLPNFPSTSQSHLTLSRGVVSCLMSDVQCWSALTVWRPTNSVTFAVKVEDIIEFCENTVLTQNSSYKLSVSYNPIYGITPFITVCFTIYNWYRTLIVWNIKRSINQLNVRFECVWKQDVSYSPNGHFWWGQWWLSSELTAARVSDKDMLAVFLSATSLSWEGCNAGWWFGTFFLFFPYIGNVIIPTDFHIFQRGWNHQPEQNWTQVETPWLWEALYA